MLRFMKLLLIAAILACAISSNAQKEVKLDELKEYIGNSVKVHGKISGVKYSSNSKQKSMLIYVADEDSKPVLTVFIPANVLNKLHIRPSLADAGNIILVSGKLEGHKGKTRINLKEPMQLDIVDNRQGELE